MSRMSAPLPGKEGNWTAAGELEFSEGFITLLESARTGGRMRATDILSRKLRVSPETLLGDDLGYGRLLDQIRAAHRRLEQMERFVAKHRRLVKDALAKVRAWVRQRDLVKKL